MICQVDNRDTHLRQFKKMSKSRQCGQHQRVNFALNCKCPNRKRTLFILQEYSIFFSVFNYLEN